MPEATVAEPDRVLRERRLVMLATALLILFRSAVLVFWPQAHFDSDQAITGLMAKHLSELRAFPVFYYGQSYMLGVEAWLAAPVFLVLGATVTALRLPLLAINIAVAWLLLRVFEREGGLGPTLALVPTLFFALPAPGTVSHLLEANGGTVEPFAYVLLLWVTRRRPAWCGVIFAVGFLQREFTLYGLLALVVIEAIEGSLFTRDGLRRTFAMLRMAAGVWLFVQWVKYYSSAAGPGTTMADVYKPKDNILELASRICWDLRTIPRGFWRILTEHWPVLFGTRVLPLTDFAIDSQSRQGLAFSGVLLALALVIPAVVVAWRLAARRAWPREQHFSAYLVLVGVLSASGYVVGRCGEVDFVVMRYELPSMFVAVGLGAWFLQLHPPAGVLRTWVIAVCALVSVAAFAHARLLGEYVFHAPVGGKQMIVRHLDARGTRYAYADYWTSYALTFLTQERIIVASNDFLRIPSYNRIVDQHRAEAIRISKWPCPGGREVIRHIFFCSE